MFSKHSSLVVWYNNINEKFYFQLQNVVDDIASLKDQIKECGNDIMATCLPKIINKMEQEIVNLPGIITDDTEEVIDSIQNFIPPIKQCGTNATMNCASQGKTVLTKISLCVSKKINH